MCMDEYRQHCTVQNLRAIPGKTWWGLIGISLLSGALAPALYYPRNVFFGNAFRTIASLELPPLTANLEEKLDPNSRNDTYNNS
jgi:hypothetical protein